MGNEFRGTAGHSAEYFGDSRDYWWNRDFLELMARRWRLDTVRDVLDVGCGVGHWGALLASVLPADARVTGIDREPGWVEQASSRALARGLGERFSYRLGTAERIPFPDDSFDFTTCQTVLIHLRDPAAALREMFRVTRPGGLVAVAEPNNLSESLMLGSLAGQASIDEVVELVRLQLTCERGKVALGEGDNSLGDRVAGLLVAQGFTDVEVFVNDKAAALFPPYSASEQCALIEDARDRAARGFWNWSETETRRFFLAGGGTEHDFAEQFARGLAARQKVIEGVDAGTYHSVSGGGFFLSAGRKPGQRA
jgi:SAM-dependent methyltransferase